MRYLLVLVLGVVHASALAGPEWPEGGDAGSVPGTAQVIGPGTGPVTKIIGRLEGPPGLPGRGMGDFEDMYLINIIEPQLFHASTALADGGLAAFDSNLWLFNADGSGLLGNLNSPQDVNAARLDRAATDGTGAEVVEPGLYYLAISSVGSAALGGVGGAPMFQFALADEISGPDGPGGFGNPIDGWVDGAQFGDYEIVLSGVALVEAECRPDLTGDGTLDFFDVQAFLAAFAGNDPIADWTNDGVFDFFDVLGFLNDFAGGCS